MQSYFAYLLLICLLHTVRTAPLPASNLINLSDQVNSNPLNQYLKEPELVKVYKDRVVFRIFPLAKKDVDIRWVFAFFLTKTFVIRPNESVELIS